jgi:hypothetical protein
MTARLTVGKPPRLDARVTPLHSSGNREAGARAGGTGVCQASGMPDHSIPILQ